MALLAAKHTQKTRSLQDHHTLPKINITQKAMLARGPTKPNWKDQWKFCLWITEMRGFLLHAWPALSVTFVTIYGFEMNHFVMISAVQALVVSKIEAASLQALFLKVTHTLQTLQMTPKNALTPCSYVITAGAIRICEPWYCWLCDDCTCRHDLPLPHISSKMRRTMLGTDKHSWHVQSGSLVDISGRIISETALTQLKQNSNETQTLNTKTSLLRSVLSICFCNIVSQTIFEFHTLTSRSKNFYSSSWQVGVASVAVWLNISQCTCLSRLPFTVALFSSPHSHLQENHIEIGALCYIYLPWPPPKYCQGLPQPQQQPQPIISSPRWSHYPKLGTWPRLPTHNSLWHHRGR